MRMIQVVKLNEIWFELKGEMSEDTARLLKSRMSGKDIFDAYRRPSPTKVSIWEDWKTDLSEFSFCDMWVQSSNSFNFSIAAILVHEGKRYYTKITQSYHYLYELV